MSRSRQHGFTLIEIMVVVLIIGMMAAVLVFNISRDLDRVARLESQRFMAVVNEVRDESIIAGEAFILSVDRKSGDYGFQSLRQDRRLAQDDGLFKTRTIKPGLQLKWDVFDDFEQAADEDAKDTGPKVFISPLGEITPFDLRFGGDQLDYHVFVNEENQLERRNEQASFR